MSRIFRPLWQLLLGTAVTRNTPPLTCSDCFAILEYLADISQANSGKTKLIQKARRHLAACPDCRTYYQKRLDELEAEFKDNV